MLVDLIQNVSDGQKSRTFQGLGHGPQEECRTISWDGKTAACSLKTAALQMVFCHQHMFDKQEVKEKMSIKIWSSKTRPRVKTQLRESSVFGLIFKIMNRDEAIQRVQRENRRGRGPRRPRRNVYKLREGKKLERNQCWCWIKEEKKQELITGFTNVKVFSIFFFF